MISRHRPAVEGLDNNKAARRRRRRMGGGGCEKHLKAGTSARSERRPVESFAKPRVGAESGRAIALDPEGKEE